MGPPPCAKYWPRREASCYEKRQTHTPTPLIVIKTPSLTLTHETQKLLSNFSPRPYIGLKKLLLLLKAGFKSNPGPVRKMEKRGAVYHQKNFHKYWSWRRCLQNQDTIILACQITKLFCGGEGRGVIKDDCCPEMFMGNGNSKVWPTDQRTDGLTWVDC